MKYSKVSQHKKNKSINGYIKLHNPTPQEFAEAIEDIINFAGQTRQIEIYVEINKKIAINNIYTQFNFDNKQMSKFNFLILNSGNLNLYKKIKKNT